MSDRIGQQIGHYRLTRLLGHGGFADVYLGEHVYLGTGAAIKILDTHLSSTEIEHFRQEARIIAQLEHPHIVHVLDFGVEDDTPFLVMSYAPNGSLRQRYTAGIPLALETVIASVKQIASALYYAHQARVIHRDIKPENMLLGRNNEILLSDFGLAIVSQNSSQQHIHDVSGTIAYMAPEQARGKPQAASDQYALALIAYEWLSGKRPFHGTYEEIMVQHAFNRPPSLSECIPEITPALDAIIMRALEKEPHLRFSTVQDFARTLEETYLAGLGITLAPSELAAYYEDPTPQIQITAPHPVERVRQGTETIYTVAWSPDKRRIAYGGRERTIQVRGATTGDSVLTYQEHSRSVTMIAWSPDGQALASASLDRTIHVWDVATGETRTIYSGHNGIVSALAWSPDNKHIASTSNGTDNTIHVWSVFSGKLQVVYKGHAQWVRTITWSPNGKTIASGAWHEIHLWDALQGKRLFIYRGHPSWIRAIDWSPNGTRIASAGEENSVQIWEPLNKGHLITEYHGHSDWVGTMIWSPDGAWIASASKDQKVHIWDAETASNISLQHVRAASAYAITWLSDSKHVVSANGNGSVQVWSIKGE